ncbi:alpha,alpha-phosphotrehalase [Terribacillus sp. DMT04]|uniref:alpha,alpha-phosphotrehalase n=1 Tax=Terribacillus sp. DMT04 TaxID=2850441 RepID=UPI001C2BB765|nr:alpha,alpha-phosphotrehalase [Terribacillus sp. DMT04]QXE02116.1 alpha,alpha-phosphotrehalase [Terribacillus sp. DMT04]
MQEPWWKRSTIYQIYPKSFNDTTGSGMGDLQGVIEKLDYIKELGVDMVWLTPIYRSPQRDNGYDISDYYDIEPAYGTMEDVERLVQELHNRDMKLMMDIVINHTSTDHEWFQQAKTSKDNPYRDYYIWRDSSDGDAPNNWVSKFGGTAWALEEHTDQYYLHLFDKTQADLNWENNEVRNKLYEMMNFWAEKGLDGFRLDVINLVSKVQSFPHDESAADGQFGKAYYTDGPRIHEFMKEMNQAVFAPHNLITVGEMSSTSLAACQQYTSPDVNELDMTFNFQHLKVDYEKGKKWTDGKLDFIKLKQILSDWQIGMHQAGGWNALFWCNHDQPRIVSRFGDDDLYRRESAKMLATVMHMMQGTPYIYQGEEIGMTDPKFSSIEDYNDVETQNAYTELKELGLAESAVMQIIQRRSRDNARTPMQWSAAKNAGFSEGEPWLSVASNYKKINAEKEVKDKDSIFYHYQKLIRLRKEYAIITHGDYEPLCMDNERIFSYERRWNGEKLLVVANFFGESTEFTYPKKETEEAEILLSNYQDSAPDYSKIQLRPYEAVIYLIKL